MKRAFFRNYHLAIGALRAAKDMSLGVPDDVSLVGFDEMHLARCSMPRPITIPQSKKELGKHVCPRML